MLRLKEIRKANSFWPSLNLSFYSKRAGNFQYLPDERELRT